MLQARAVDGTMVSNIQENIPIVYNSSSPLWVTYKCYGKPPSYTCELVREWQENVDPLSSDVPSNQSCSLSLVDRTDCGSKDKKTCESKGCCWQKVSPNPIDAPWCFKKGNAGGGPAPANKVLPFAPADCFVTTPAFATSELLLQKDVIYGSAVNPYFLGFDKTEILKLDLLQPPARDQRKARPALVWMHGGAYLSGDKGDDLQLRQSLASRGYVVISINYRMVANSAIPAIWALLSVKPAVIAAQDARAAVRYLHRHAADLRVDPERIVVGGESAGALASNVYGFTTNYTEGVSGNAGYDSRINSVLSVSGSMRDLAFCAGVGGPPGYQPYLCVISSPPGKDLTKELVAGDIPVVDLHGTKDTIIPYKAGKEMIDRAASVGAQGLLLTIPGAGHVPMGNIMDPKEPYLMKWLNFTSGALNLAQAECPSHATLMVI
jgi:acetyl esterase/lipase